MSSSCFFNLSVESVSCLKTFLRCCCEKYFIILLSLSLCVPAAASPAWFLRWNHWIEQSHSGAWCTQAGHLNLNASRRVNIVNCSLLSLRDSKAKGSKKNIFIDLSESKKRKINQQVEIDGFCPSPPVCTDYLILWLSYVYASNKAFCRVSKVYRNENTWSFSFASRTCRLGAVQ